MSTTKTEQRKEVKDSTKLTRLNKLIRYLKHIEKTEPERFNIYDWITPLDDDDDDSDDSYTDSFSTLVKAKKEWRERYKNGEPLNCGTSACVVGHLPVLFPSSWEWFATDYVRNKDWKLIEEEDSMAKFFGGTGQAWASVIYACNYDPTEKDDKGDVTLSAVIKRIEKLRDRTYKNK